MFKFASFCKFKMSNSSFWILACVLLTFVCAGSYSTHVYASNDDEYSNRIEKFRYRQVVVDDRFIYLVSDDRLDKVTDPEASQGTKYLRPSYEASLHIYDHNYHPVGDLKFSQQRIIRVVRDGDQLLIIAHGPRLYSELPECETFWCSIGRFFTKHRREEVPVWKAVHTLFRCDLTGDCNVIRQGEFGIFAVVPFRDGLITSEYDWSGRVDYEQLRKGPVRSRLTYITDSSAEEIPLPTDGGVWDLDVINNENLYVVIYYTGKENDEIYKKYDGLYEYKNNQFSLIETNTSKNKYSPDKMTELCDRFEDNKNIFICQNIYGYYKSNIMIWNTDEKELKYFKKDIISDIFMNKGFVIFIGENGKLVKFNVREL